MGIKRTNDSSNFDFLVEGFFEVVGVGGVLVFFFDLDEAGRLVVLLLVGLEDLGVGLVPGELVDDVGLALAGDFVEGLERGLEGEDEVGLDLHELLDLVGDGGEALAVAEEDEDHILDEEEALDAELRLAGVEVGDVFGEVECLGVDGEDARHSAKMTFA